MAWSPTKCDTRFIEIAERHDRNQVLELQSEKGDTGVQVLVNRCHVQCHSITMLTPCALVTMCSAKRRSPEIISAPKPAIAFLIQTEPGYISVITPPIWSAIAPNCVIAKIGRMTFPT